MLNQSGIIKVTGVAPTQILLNTDLQYSMGVVVTNTGLTADSEGKKILKAGTPITGNLDARTTAFTKATTAGDSTPASNAVGVLLHDVDVTKGPANGTILIFGFVNTNRLDSTVKTLIDAAVKTALNGKITFIAG